MEPKNLVEFGNLLRPQFCPNLYLKFYFLFLWFVGSNLKLGGFMHNFVVKFPLDPIKSSLTREAGKFAKQFLQFAKICV